MTHKLYRCTAHATTRPVGRETRGQKQATVLFIVAPDEDSARWAANHAAYNAACRLDLWGVGIEGLHELKVTDVKAVF